MLRIRSSAFIALIRSRGRSPMDDRRKYLCVWLLQLALTCQFILPCSCTRCGFCEQIVCGGCSNAGCPENPAVGHSHREQNYHTSYCCDSLELRNEHNHPAIPAPVDSPCHKSVAYVDSSISLTNVRPQLRHAGDAWVSQIESRNVDPSRLSGNVDPIAGCSSPSADPNSTRGARLQV